MSGNRAKKPWALCYHPAQHWTVAELVSAGPFRLTVRASWGEVFRCHRTRSKLFCDRTDAVAAQERIEAAWKARKAAEQAAEADYWRAVESELA